MNDNDKVAVILTREESTFLVAKLSEDCAPDIQMRVRDAALTAARGPALPEHDSIKDVTMIRPEEVAHRNYMIWEQTIDAYLRAHSWNEIRSCSIPLAASPESLEPILSQYKAVGWGVRAEDTDDSGHPSQVHYIYVFTLPDGITLDSFS